MKESYREKVRYILLGVLLTFLASVAFFYIQKDYEETKQRENYYLAWTIKNNAVSSYLTKDVEVTNYGNKPLHKVTLIMTFNKKILFHSLHSAITPYDSNNKVITNDDIFKGQKDLNIHWDFFPPHTTLTTKIILDEKINDAILKEILTEKDPCEDIRFKSLSCDEVEGVFIKSQ